MDLEFQYQEVSTLFLLHKYITIINHNLTLINTIYYYYYYFYYGD